MTDPLIPVIRDLLQQADATLREAQRLLPRYAQQQTPPERWAAHRITQARERIKRAGESWDPDPPKDADA